MVQIFSTAISIAKNPRVQRIVIGAIVGGAVGYAIARTVEPFIFPEPEYEMIPPYDTPEKAIARDDHQVAVLLDRFITPTHIDQIGTVTKIETTPDEVAATVRIESAPKPKYMKPVKQTVTHAAAVQPTIQPTTAPEKLEAIKKPVDVKPPSDSFSSTRGEPASIAGGGNPHKKTRPTDGE